MIPALPRPAPDELAAASARRSPDAVAKLVGAFAELCRAASDERGISGVAG
jgi:hypothetical protein